ncbi:hypothetical protein BLNAU_4067 [Blattamonas nauphoetae]|uniref:BZIP domain-containing protein n=1 Tax=Blattamonas nauphoetae TaxID=2049346 RepID=A0ABQ9YBC2_9EUKA|nr:hypothetical protein BLNAU_4067 [Blattamonas nauphoetae]
MNSSTLSDLTTLQSSDLNYDALSHPNLFHSSRPLHRSVSLLSLDKTWSTRTEGSDELSTQTLTVREESFSYSRDSKVSVALRSQALSGKESSSDTKPSTDSSLPSKLSSLSSKLSPLVFSPSPPDLYSEYSPGRLDTNLDQFSFPQPVRDDQLSLNKDWVFVDNPFSIFPPPISFPYLHQPQQQTTFSLSSKDFDDDTSRPFPPEIDSTSDSKASPMQQPTRREKEKERQRKRRKARRQRYQKIRAMEKTLMEAKNDSLEVEIKVEPAQQQTTAPFHAHLSSAIPPSSLPKNSVHNESSSGPSQLRWIPLALPSSETVAPAKPTLFLSPSTSTHRPSQPPTNTHSTHPTLSPPVTVHPTFIPAFTHPPTLNSGAPSTLNISPPTRSPQLHIDTKLPYPSVTVSSEVSLNQKPPP